MARASIVAHERPKIDPQGEGVLNRKRNLSINMIRALYDKLGISAESLIRAIRGPLVERSIPSRPNSTFPIPRRPALMGAEGGDVRLEVNQSVVSG